MITPQHQPLWDRILAFPLDDPKAATPFSAKLAINQKWSRDLTLRAIEEYRKFIFLCCISKNGAAPSRIVDEVWHLHLTYTQSYWFDFCKNTLSQDIHHHPSAGGKAENHKHAGWYNETLDLYATIFDAPPPPDIWPRQQQSPEIAEPPLAWTGLIRFIPFLLILPFAFIQIQYGKLWPFNLRGPEFLYFFPLFGLATIGSYILYRLERKKQLDLIVEDNFPRDVNPFQIAGLLYGKHRALQAGILDLIQRGMLDVESDNLFRIHNGNYDPGRGETNPLAPKLLQQPDNTTLDYNTMMAEWFERDRFLHPGLERLDRFAHRKPGFWQSGYYWQTLLFFVFVARTTQGILNDRPVVFLIVEMSFFSILAIIVTAVLNRRPSIYTKIKQLFAQQVPQTNPGLNDAGMLPQFALSGQSAMQGLAEGAILLAIFSNYDPRSFRSNPDTWDNSNMGSTGGDTSSWSGSDSGSDSGSSCSSDGGGGSSCGGCGGGGGD